MCEIPGPCLRLQFFSPFVYAAVGDRFVQVNVASKDVLQMPSGDDPAVRAVVAEGVSVRAIRVFLCEDATLLLCFDSKYSRTEERMI